MKHVKQKLRELQKEIGKATITVGALSTLSSVTDEQVDRKLVLAQSTNLTRLTYIEHSTQQHVFPSAYEIFTKIDHFSAA